MFRFTPTLCATFAYLFLKKYPGDICTLANLLGHNDLKTTTPVTRNRLLEETISPVCLLVKF
jgi:hypothetical protein